MSLTVVDYLLVFPDLAVPDKVQRDKNKEGNRTASTLGGVLSRTDELLSRWIKDD